MEADWDDAPQFTEEIRQAIRARFTRQIIVAGKYDKVRAEWVLSKGYADLIAFGRPFVANLDLPRRLAKGLPLAAFDPNTLFGGNEVGCTDYPGWRDTRRVSAAGEAAAFYRTNRSRNKPKSRLTYGRSSLSPTWLAQG